MVKPDPKPKLKELVFVGGSKKDLSDMPQDVKDTVGHALYMSQLGQRAASNVKTLSGHGQGVMQVMEDDDGNTYRAVYTIHYDDVVYVVHCFKKKSTSGISVPKHEQTTIDLRLGKIAEREQAKALAKKRAVKSVLTVLK